MAFVACRHFPTAANNPGFTPATTGQHDDFTSQGFDWYARYVGEVKWMSISEGSTTVLTAIWVDTDGYGINVVDDNCPEDWNPDQMDTDGDGLGNACDADDCMFFVIPNTGGGASVFCL